MLISIYGNMYVVVVQHHHHHIFRLLFVLELLLLKSVDESPILFILRARDGIVIVVVIYF